MGQSAAQREPDDRAEPMADGAVVTLSANTADAMRDIGQRIGERLNPGDVLVLIGPLGAGKTTLTQGIARGIGAIGQVTSPTFVISRIHRDAGGTAVLVHVDAYRLQSIADLETLDLDDYLPTAAVVVEWGQRVLDLDDPRYIVVTIDREAGDGELGDAALGNAALGNGVLDDSGTRTITVSGRLAALAD